MPPWPPFVHERMLTLGEGFWPVKNSTEVMCSIFSFNNVRVVSEEQQKCGEVKLIAQTRGMLNSLWVS